jgi:Glucose/sorbosone dehydrogenases
MVQAPHDTSHWYIAGKGGIVLRFENDESVSTTETVIDIRSRVESSCAECGLVGIAFHPDFPQTPRVYLAYTSIEHTLRGPNTHLSEFTSPDGGRTLDPDSERILIRIIKDGPHHHGGQILFGRDGYLYFAAGDGQGTLVDSSQVLNRLRGKMIRIDVNKTTGNALYGIPSDNPYASSTDLCYEDGTGPGACPEIWALGIRNPWRWTFDRETGDIWLGDVGQEAREEVNRIVRGGNYGWRCFEGTLRTSMTCDMPANPRPPIAEYDREHGRAVTGGYVYRGSKIPALYGRYVFADFVSGRIWDIPNDTQPTMLMTGGLETGLNISSFAEAPDGELYFLNLTAVSIESQAQAPREAVSRSNSPRPAASIRRIPRSLQADSFLTRRLQSLVGRCGEGALDRIARRPEHHDQS